MRDYKYPSPIIAERIQEVFDKNNLKDGEVAKAIEVERKTILAYRNAQSNPSVKFIRYICAKCHVDANWLLDMRN